MSFLEKLWWHCNFCRTLWLATATKKLEVNSSAKKAKESLLINKWPVIHIQVADHFIRPQVYCTWDSGHCVANKAMLNVHLPCSMSIVMMTVSDSCFFFYNNNRKKYHLTWPLVSTIWFGGYHNRHQTLPVSAAASEMEVLKNMFRCVACFQHPTPPPDQAYHQVVISWQCSPSLHRVSRR